MSLPDGFWWGTTAASTSAEGAAPRADWYRWEHEGRAPRSADGNGFAHRHADDFRMLAEHGLVHHLLTLEWARLEPVEGKRDRDAVDRYTDLLRAARDAGVRPWVALHDVSLPGWFSDDQRGFLDERGRGYHWARHVDFVAETFGELVEGWVPVVAPHAWAVHGWLLGDHPPGRRDPARFGEALEAAHLANHEAWRLLSSGEPPVMAVHDVGPRVPADDRPETAAAARRAEAAQWQPWVGMVRDGVLRVPGRAPREDGRSAGAFDLVGLAYRGGRTVAADGTLGPYPTGERPNPAGDVPFAEGLRLALDRAADELPGRDLVVAGCGWAMPAGEPEGERQASFVADCLEHVAAAVEDGVRVRGYLHATAVDTYAWVQGWTVHTGLFDRERAPRPAADVARRWAQR